MSALDAQRSQAVIDVLRERFRQEDEEGFDAGTDDKHGYFDLAAAAAAYAWAASLSSYDRGILTGEPHSFLRRHIWPHRWDLRWWKPKDRRRDLVRSAALTLAAIEAFDRNRERGGA